MKRSLMNVLALGSLLFSAFVACGDDDDSDTDTDAPAGPPSIRITGFVGADNRVTERDDENALEICGDRFGVVIEVTANTWTFRPPGRCGESAQCGYVAVSLDPESGSLISQNSINLTTMLDLTGEPALPGEGGAGGESAQGGAPGLDSEVSEGNHRVRVELRNDDGSAFLLDGAPVADEAEVDLSFVPCPTSNGSGSGGAGGQPGAGGSPSGGAGDGVEGGAGGNAGDLGGAGGIGVGGQPDLGGAGGAG